MHDVDSDSDEIVRGYRRGILLNLESTYIRNGSVLTPAQREAVAKAGLTLVESSIADELKRLTPEVRRDVLETERLRRLHEARVEAGLEK